MISISLSLDPDLAIAALTQARIEGTDVEDFLTSTLREALTTASPGSDDARVADRWLDEAVKRAKGIEPQSSFKLQDLFTKEEWKRIPSPTVFGRAFRKLAEHQGFAAHIGKTPVNQAIYERK